MTPSSPELTYTALSATLTGSLWIPIIVNRIREVGVASALTNPAPEVRPRASWAYRLASAHRNSIENLVVFAPLALAVHALGLGTQSTAAAAIAFFWSRVAHAVTYTFDIPLLRTVAFVVGFGAQITLFLRLIGGT